MEMRLHLEDEQYARLEREAACLGRGIAFFAVGGARVYPSTTVIPAQLAPQAGLDSFRGAP